MAIVRTEVQVAINEMIDMVNNCHSKGIDVIFYTVPWQGEYVYGLQ